MNTHRAILSLLLPAALAAAPLRAQSLYPGIDTPQPLAAECQALSFPLGDVRLLPSRFTDNMRLDSAWMMSLSVPQLLHNFRTMAGVYAGPEGGYMTVGKLGGWESADCELRGHAVGHYLSACALLYASTGHEVFRLKGDSLVSALRQVQLTLGTGYLSAFPEELINRNLRGERVWAPWYTLHKLLAGLLDQYALAHNAEALEAARGMARWAYAKLHGQSEQTRALMLRNEFGGMNEAFYNLYSLTGSDESLWLARWFCHDEVVQPLRQGQDNLGTSHANTFIPKLLGEARNYELTGSASSRRAALQFYSLAQSHLFVTGSLSDKEHFFPSSEMSRHLSGYTGETCCTYNMLKLARHLFCWDASGAVADFYERALYNHILGQQDPSTGMVAYFLPLLSGAHKVYSTPRRSFWCCVGSGFESHAKYGEAVYYHRDAHLWVNLFVPSVLSWREQGVTLTQRTRFPLSDTSTLSLAVPGGQSRRLVLHLRYPQWSGQPTVRVNGKKVKVKARRGDYIVVDRTWHDGDSVSVACPMSLRLEATPDDPTRAAVMYGPLVLAGCLGTEGMVAPAPFSDPSRYNDYYTYDYHVPASLPLSLPVAPDADLSKVLTRADPDSLVFTTPWGHTLRPLCDVHRERYVVYWQLQP